MRKLILLSLCVAGMISPSFAQFSMHAGAPATTNGPTVQSVQPEGPEVAMIPFVNFGWANYPALPGGRWATGPVFVKPCLSLTDTGFVYLISGYDAAFANTTENTRYNTVTGTYRTMAPIPQSRGQISPVEVNGKIYVIGGYGGSFSPVTTNSIYDIATDTWSTGAPLPQATGDYAIGVYNDSLIYIVGGYTGSNDVNGVQIYDTYLNTWAPGTPKIGAAVAGCRMGISGNQIVFVGGYSQTLVATQSASYLGTINPSAPGTITWTSLGAYPGGTTGRHASGVSLEPNGLVYFAGGDPTGQGTQTINQTHAYNTLLGTWETGPNMPVGVSNICTLAGAVLNDSLYMVTMAGYNGAAVTTSHSWLNIGPAAPSPTVQNDTVVCMGSSIQLNAMNAVMYSWAPAATLNNASIANPVATTTATITYTVTMEKAYGCPVVDMITLTVNPLPVVSANSTADTVCAGTQVTLAGNGANTYSWTGGVIDNVAFTPVATNTYTVTGTDVNGCTNSDEITVTVNVLPTVVANTTATAVCDGSPVTLSGTGATSYVWSGGVTDSLAFVPVSTTTYTVTGTDANGCVNTDSINVQVNPNPSVTVTLGQDTACTTAGNITLNGESPAGGTWSGPGVTGNSFDPVAAGMGNIMIMYMFTDANGCSGSAIDSIWVDICSDITNVSANGNMSLFPNPASTQFTIQLATAPNAAVTVEVTNELGQVVNSFTMTGTTQQVNMTTLESGVYFVRVINGDEVSVHRVVKN